MSSASSRIKSFRKSLSFKEESVYYPPGPLSEHFHGAVIFAFLVFKSLEKE